MCRGCVATVGADEASVGGVRGTFWSLNCGWRINWPMGLEYSGMIGQDCAPIWAN